MSEQISHAAAAPATGVDQFASAGQSTSPFDAAVFAGGGCRCFWQVGFWEVAAPALGIRPRVVIGTSAGSAFACSALSGSTPRVLEDFKRRAADNARNFYPRRLLGSQPAFPHERIYRGCILENIDDEALATLNATTDLRVLLARPMRPLASGRRIRRTLMLTMALATHYLNRRERLVHASWGYRLGFQPEVVSVRSCGSADELADLILHASCAPPLLPLYQRDQLPVLDGGLIDNAPADYVAPARSTLVLLSFRYDSRKIPRTPGRVYVQPSEEVPIAEWDYTRPDLIQATYDLGRRDGEAFARTNATRETASGEAPIA
jgi:predicted acylesterase/phospholipase RssA